MRNGSFQRILMVVLLTLSREVSEQSGPALCGWEIEFMLSKTSIPHQDLVLCELRDKEKLPSGMA